MIFNVTGIVLSITEDAKGVSQKGEWIKHKVKILTRGSEPKQYVFDTFVKNIDFNKDCLVDVAFVIEQKEFNGKHYTNIVAIKFEIKGVPMPLANMVNNIPQEPEITPEPTNDLPF